MEYEIVTLEAKHIAGITSRTNNFSPDCGAVIGGLWTRFYQEAFGEIPEKINASSIALYHHYDSDEKGDYDLTIGCETTAQSLPESLTAYTIPSGQYAKFTVKGNVQTAVQAFW
ncbi:MAG: effector binding domain-containing protein, partial [Eubacterium sp.]